MHQGTQAVLISLFVFCTIDVLLREVAALLRGVDAPLPRGVVLLARGVLLLARGVVPVEALHEVFQALKPFRVVQSSKMTPSLALFTYQHKYQDKRVAA